MALKATIFKVELQVSDLDRPHYGSYLLTVARHPSETDERLMVRLLAFALYASDGLRFGRGLSTEDEADLFEQDPTGLIERWIDVGTPDPRDIRKAGGLSKQVVVLTYGRTVDVWWRQHGAVLSGQRNLAVLRLPAETGAALAALAARNMSLQYLIQDGSLWLTAGEVTIQVEPEWLLRHEP
ncbi:YaeQ family protein [Thioalkalivibrio sp.]|uniref:YaeQ family protein n=1 Tax=Thioalkalivibrio sp. TaxID=2093813 RepID=UPI003976A6D7